MIERDDPRLTAYALGEADPETARIVEAALRDSDGLRQEVDEIRGVADRLSRALAAEEAPSLLPVQRRAIEEQAPAVRRRASARTARWAWAASIVAAAGAGLVIGRGLARQAIPAPYTSTLIRPSANPTEPLPRPPASPAADAVIAAVPVPSVGVAPLVAGGAATVDGVVRDKMGAVVPGAAATVTAAPSGAVATTSDTEGMAETVTVESPGSINALGLRLGYGAPSADFPRATPAPELNTEAYAHRQDSDFMEVAVHPLSTFSVDVDTASYTNVRRFLNAGQRPPVDAVRIEEMLNYFPYDYAPPENRETFAAHVEIAPAPWKREHQLVRIGIKAREIAPEDRPPSNLVFLIDVSGSMNAPNKLPLVQQSLKLLVRRLDRRDRVALVVYAGSAGLVLPPTQGDRQEALLEAIDRLRAGGSTNGGEGIQLAYDIAAREFIRGGVNRVVLATDGDFNVGTTDEGGLVRLVQRQAERGVFLTVLGFGMGNLQDSRLETLADKGNGHYAYVDTENEARKALVEEMTSTLVTVAKDVKIQVEWNPARVLAYRLIGYENRALAPEDFKDDRKDAGEVGAGHAVTALYELIPVGGRLPQPRTDPLTYQRPAAPAHGARGGELLTLKLRHKEPEGQTSQAREWRVTGRPLSPDETSTDYRFAAAVAQFGMLLRGSPHKGASDFGSVLALAEGGRGEDRSGYRAEFVTLVKKAQELMGRE